MTPADTDQLRALAAAREIIRANPGATMTHLVAMAWLEGRISVCRELKQPQNSSRDGRVTPVGDGNVPDHSGAARGLAASGANSHDGAEASHLAHVGATHAGRSGPADSEVRL